MRIAIATFLFFPPSTSSCEWWGASAAKTPGWGAFLRKYSAHPRPRERALLASDPAASRREGRRVPAPLGRAQFHQRRQKTRERLAGAGGRDQQRRAVVAGFFEQRQLMLARRPAARGKPATELIRQQGFVVG